MGDNWFFAAVGGALDYERRKRGVTQQQVADALGKHRPAVTLLAQGAQRLTLLDAWRWSRMMGVSLDEVCRMAQSAERAPQRKPAG